MLVLNRKKDQSVKLDGPGEVRIVSIRGNSVRLGIIAPNSTTALRDELVDFNSRSAHESCVEKDAAED